MKQLRVAILVTSILALALAAAGSLIVLDPALFGISTDCSGCIIPPWWIYGFLVAGLGGLIALAALVLAVVDAVTRRDGPTLGLLILLVILNIGASIYLNAARSTTSGPGGASAGAPSIAAVLIGVVALSFASPPIIALLYALLHNLRVPRLFALGALAALLVIVPLVIAPPWIVFNPANGAPNLSVSAPNVTVDCTTAQYPPITLKNAGAGTLRWTSFAAFDAVSISPSSGSLGPGASQSVTLSGAYTPASGRPNQVGVEFDSNGGSQRVTYDCQGAAGATPTPSGGISVSPPGIVASCQQGTYPPITLTNTSQTDASWTAATKEPGIVLTPQGGTLHAGQSQSVAISGITSSSTFAILVNGGSQTVTVACK